jgi:uncharacterized protein YegP (UPF0339 family)
MTPNHTTTGARIRYYRDKRKQWRWQAIARNGRVVADSAEGYRRLADALRGCAATCNAIQCQRIEVERP